MLLKERLNSNGQQFHQYQQNEQPPLAPKSLNIKKKYHDTCMTLGIKVLAWDRQNIVAGLNLLMGSQLSLDKWISNCNTDICNQ